MCPMSSEKPGLMGQCASIDGKDERKGGTLGGMKRGRDGGRQGKD